MAFEQKEAARLAEIDKIKTNFFSNITHEFRMPLTLIRNSERLLGLVNQLLDLSKLESKKMTFELKRGNFGEFVTPIIQSFQTLAKQKEIQFTYHVPNELFSFNFDKNKVEKILYNLISNAIKFTKSKGSTFEFFIPIVQAAYQLLKDKKGNITEIAFIVGFSSPKYFSTKFKEKYKVSPRKI